MKKITTNTKTLSNAVAIANTYTSKDGDYAGAITFVGNDGMIEVKATDNMQTIIFKNISFVSADLTDNSFDAITLDGKKLATVLKVTKSDEVIIELHEDHIVVKSSRSRVKISTQAKAQEIEIEKGYGKTLEIGNSIKSIHYLVHAIDTNNPKFELNGLFINVKKGNVDMVATDSKRLAVVSSETSMEDMHLILPRQTVLTIDKLFSDVDIETEADDVLFSIHSPFISYSTKLINGKYPEYKRILPTSFSQTVMLNVKEFKETVEEASMFESDILITIKNQALAASDISKNTNVQMQKDESMYIHTDLQFAIYAKYILDVLASCDSEEIQLCFNDSNIPIALKTGEFQEVIMPIALPDVEENESSDSREAA
ncbi:DNA polymerase III subunit beta [Sulfurimonas indica]|uniref:DNA polymerase III subunit beta n=1 Tax=Sulfurimonas TaxID=202746 RepID=UPI0012648FBB|nr:DNA polymerase III subunit beta [Sulfurimonas indica]